MTPSTKFLLTLGLSLLLPACEEDAGIPVPAAEKLTLMPAVSFTQTDYTIDNVLNGRLDTTLAQRFRTTYTELCTQGVKLQLVDYIAGQAKGAGFAEDEVRGCLQATGFLDTAVSALPLQAERALYQSHPAWIFEFLLGSGNHLGAWWKCFVVDAQSREVLLSNMPK